MSLKRKTALRRLACTLAGGFVLGIPLVWSQFDLPTGATQLEAAVRRTPLERRRARVQKAQAEHRMEMIEQQNAAGKGDTIAPVMDLSAGSDGVNNAAGYESNVAGRAVLTQFQFDPGQLDSQDEKSGIFSKVINKFRRQEEMPVQPPQEPPTRYSTTSPGHRVGVPQTNSPAQQPSGQNAASDSMNTGWGGGREPHAAPPTTTQEPQQFPVAGQRAQPLQTASKEPVTLDLSGTPAATPQPRQQPQAPLSGFAFEEGDRVTDNESLDLNAEFGAGAMAPKQSPAPKDDFQIDLNGTPKSAQVPSPSELGRATLDSSDDAPVLAIVPMPMESGTSDDAPASIPVVEDSVESPLETPEFQQPGPAFEFGGSSEPTSTPAVETPKEISADADVPVKSEAEITNPFTGRSLEKQPTISPEPTLPETPAELPAVSDEVPESTPEPGPFSFSVDTAEGTQQPSPLNELPSIEELPPLQELPEEPSESTVFEKPTIEQFRPFPDEEQVAAEPSRPFPGAASEAGISSTESELPTATDVQEEQPKTVAAVDPLLIPATEVETSDPFLSTPSEEVKNAGPELSLGTTISDKVVEAEPTEVIEPTLEAAPAPKLESPSDRMSRIKARAGLSGLKGYCPVVLRDRRDLADATPEFSTVIDGKRYEVSSAEALQALEAEPEKYIPVARGNDLVHRALTGEDREGSLENAAWYQGRLYLFATTETMETFVAAPEAHMTK